jgi:hypothetical protein
MAVAVAGLRQLHKLDLAQYLEKGVALQVRTFDPKDLERTPYVSG